MKAQKVLCPWFAVDIFGDGLMKTCFSWALHENNVLRRKPYCIVYLASLKMAQSVIAPEAGRGLQPVTGTFEDRTNLQNLSDGVTNPITLR